WQFGHFIWWVHKNKIKGIFARGHEFKHVPADTLNSCQVELPGRGVDVLDAFEMDIHGSNPGSATRGHFKSYISRTCAEIQHFHTLKINTVLQDVEQRFLRHVCCWTHGQVGWWL